MTRPRPPRSLLDLQRSLGDFLARFVPEGERVALGVSGGADSLALLQAAARLARRDKRPPWKFLAIHVDHGVRPDSAEDAAFVRERCAALSVDCAIETRQASPGASEESLRELRYAAFAEAMTQAGARFLALAHHRDDQAETLLHRLIRGTGPEGLAGMAPQTERGGLILLRPFLDLSREDLRAILAREGISWREDASNADARFTRNRVRGELIPLLQDAFNPRVAERLADLARQCDADRAYWARQIEGRLAGEEMYPDALRLDWLATTPAALQSRLLLYWLSDLTKFLPPNIRREQPGRVHVEDLASFFPSAETGASIETANGFRVRREASWLRALAPGTDAPPLNMIGGVVIERPIPLEPNAMLSLSGGRRLSGKEWAAPRHLACDLLAPGEPPHRQRSAPNAREPFSRGEARGPPPPGGRPLGVAGPIRWLVRPAPPRAQTEGHPRTEANSSRLARLSAGHRGRERRLVDTGMACPAEGFMRAKERGKLRSDLDVVGAPEDNALFYASIERQSIATGTPSTIFKRPSRTPRIV
jgi:tRNA(Ile)-lysidine synthetase-like protein